MLHVERKRVKKILRE